MQPRERHRVAMTRTAFASLADSVGFVPTTATRDLTDEGWTDGLAWAWVQFKGEEVTVSAYALNDIGRLVDALGLGRVAA